jgi:hypothetical protein
MADARPICSLLRWACSASAGFRGMAEAMRLLGVGLRFSFLALVGWGWLSGCSTRALENSDGAVLSSRGATTEHESAPQQVVQRMVSSATPGSASSGSAPKAPSGASAESGVAGEGMARARTSAAVSRAGGALAPRSNPAETITSKHLEAELNRLEAELAN